MEPLSPTDPDLDFGVPTASSPAPDFRAAERITQEVLECLAQGALGRAASLIASSGAEVGDALLACKGLSAQVSEALADSFFQARDFDRAALAAERLENRERAAYLLERSGQFLKAAGIRERLRQLDQAADLYERGGDGARAGTLFLQLGRLDRAAEAFDRAGNLFEAGRLWARQRRLDRAIEVLQRIDPSAPHYVLAVQLLGRILEFSGHPEAAAARYREVVDQRPLDASTIEIHERLIQFHVQGNHVADARRLIARVLRFEPARPYPTRALGQLLGKGSTEATMRSAVPDTSAPSLTRPHSSEQPVHVTTLNPVIDQLRQLPLFNELSLRDLRALHEAGEVASYPQGALLLEQDHEATHFFVILAGAVEVVRVLPTSEVPLAELRYGACVGEMALLDEGPSSARVRTRVDTQVFRWPLDRLRRLLDADERAALRILRVMSRALSVRLRETLNLVR